MFDGKNCLKKLKNLWVQKAINDGLKQCNDFLIRIRKHREKSQNNVEKSMLIEKEEEVLKYRLKFENARRKQLCRRKGTALNRVKWNSSRSAFNKKIRTFIITNKKHKDPENFLSDCLDIFRRRLRITLNKDVAVKVNATFCGQFQNQKKNEIISEKKYFTTSNAPIFRNTNLPEWFNTEIQIPIMKELEEFQERDSGWTLSNVVELEITISKYTLLLGSSYIELPEAIKKKEACINVKNKDNACFAWAVISAIRPVDKNPQRLTKYPHYSTILKLRGIQFPMTMKQIPHFEKQNSISINVYVLKKKDSHFITLPNYLTKNKLNNHVNLLLIQNTYDDKDVPKSYHYVWIKNLSRLVSSQLSKEKKKKFICDTCLHFFRIKEKFEQHIKECHKINKTAIKMPEPGENILKFKNFQNKEKVPFVIYADLESILKPTHNETHYQEHIASAVGYYVKCSYDDSLSFYRSHRDVDCMKWFAEEVNQFAENVETVFLCDYPIDISPQQEEEFHKATSCHICDEPFDNERKVRDHNHFLAKNNYRGAAHSNCNINYKNSFIIPIVFHNLSGYDAHFIIEEIATRMPGNIDLLPITKEKYISFTKNYKDYSVKFRFIDSFRFMSSSLDQLASYLECFPNLKSQFLHLSDQQFHLLTKKGVMPYDYIVSFKSYSETALPPIDAFYNELEGRKCPRRKYTRARIVWNTFKCRNLGEYLDLYLKTDILLLADVFEQFRQSCHMTYKLDPAHYYTLPGYTWDAMLKYTKQNLMLLTDIDMYLFVERGIRGGLSQVCSKRRAHANNKYLNKYDSKKTTKYLMYYDMNNQYGWAMSQYLPYGGFQWIYGVDDQNDTITENTVTKIDVTQIPDDAAEGYILEVDLEYPESLHDAHKDIPFCPEHIHCKTRKPSRASQPNAKLMATLHPKSKYVIHYRNLKQALKNGLKLKKVHRVLKFQQSPWLKSYIDLNTDKRKNARNEFEKNLFKLMNNAVFGKTMENIRKRVKVYLRTEWKGRYGAEKLISKPEFKNITVFKENLVAIELKALQLYFNKPIYVGMSILDLSKSTIYDFHYGYMKEKFKDTCVALYTDTDSLIYELESDPYELMKSDCHEHFDTSDYPLNNRYGIPLVNKKTLGMMKDENCGVPMTDFVGLRSKLYVVKSLITEDDKNAKRLKWKNEEYDSEEIESLIQNYGVSKKAKGVKKSVVRSGISFEDYIECLETWEKKTVSQNIIQSKNHRVYSLTKVNTALSPEDDKRYPIPGSFDTLPWGHYSLTNNTSTSMDIPKNDEAGEIWPYS